MTPGARAQAAIEILGALADAGPADAFLSRFFRTRRYIGAKDRRAVADLVFGVLRRRAQLDWWIAAGDPAAPAPPSRRRVIAGLVLLDGWRREALEAAFDGGPYRPTPLSAPERDLIARLAVAGTIAAPGQPDPVRFNYPAWLDPSLRAALGGDFAREMAALLEPAPVDLRVNSLKATREEALAALAAEGVEAAPTPISPLGLRLPARQALPALAAFRNGLVEVQDEGSQIAALLVDARPGQTVLDYCAGAGGKTLALAAAMCDRGRIVACDADRARMRHIGARLARAGATIVERALLDRDGSAAALAEGAFDRVLVDAPCSGTGVWRRAPDARWRLDPAALRDHAKRQRAILAAAARYTAKGGRLVYVTCSLLQEENEAQIERFLGNHTVFEVLPFNHLWPDTTAIAAAGEGPFLRLSPGRHGTDGFFVAILERRR